MSAPNADAPSRIKWQRDGWTAEIGVVNGVPLFRIAPPSNWVPEFQLSSPLLSVVMEREGGTYFPVAPETVHTGRPTVAEMRQAVADDRARYQAARAAAKAAAEALLVEFARSVLGLDAPT